MLNFFLGKYGITTRKKNAARLINLCMRGEIAYSKPVFCDDCFSLECHKKEYEKITSACEKRGIEICGQAKGGLPLLFSKYKTRIGLLVGGLLAILTVFLSLNVVWRIDVSGNFEVSFGEIEKILCDSGFSVGSFIPSLDVTEVENSVLKNNSSIAWISINMKGTVASVEVLESKYVEEKSQAPAHLVAARDGKVERIEAYNGSCAVKVGDVVKAGDLLVSGIYSDEIGILRTARADGEIFARTVREFFIEIPYQTSEKVYTGRKKSEIYINFFKNYIKVFSNSRNLPSTCDIIYKNGEVGLFAMPKIPVGYKRIDYLEYETVSVTLNESEAMERAFSTLERELDKLSGQVELLEKNLEFEINDRAYVLKCSLVCIENIASTGEIVIK